MTEEKEKSVWNHDEGALDGIQTSPYPISACFIYWHNMNEELINL